MTRKKQIFIRSGGKWKKVSIRTRIRKGKPPIREYRTAGTKKWKHTKPVMSFYE